MGDISNLHAAIMAHEGKLENNENGEDEPDQSDPKPDRQEMVHMTAKDSPNAALFRRLEQKGWMQEQSASWPADAPDEIKESTLEYAWTEKGIRLLPQLLAYYFASDNISPEHEESEEIS